MLGAPPLRLAASSFSCIHQNSSSAAEIILRANIKGGSPLLEL